ncbi:MAG: hypothetical protein ACE5NC_10635, partial [Anaerolineae bacterium]
MRLNAPALILPLTLALLAAPLPAEAQKPGPRLIPINDPTQRVEFDGFSILPPRGRGWVMVVPPPQVNPNLTAKAYFIKRLTEGVTPPSELHRVTAVVRTLSLGDVKI